MKNYRKYITLLCCCVCFSAVACKSKTASQARNGVPATQDTVAQMPGSAQQPAVSTDEQQFPAFYAAFRQAVEQNEEKQLENMLHFPLQTALKWADEDLKNMEVDKNAGKVSRQEFRRYYKDIFTADVKRVLPKASDDALSEISESAADDYYRSLRQETDPGSKMYEVYLQFPEQNTQAETYFAFVFGKVKGEYKVISYHAKWPVKD